MGTVNILGNPPSRPASPTTPSERSTYSTLEVGVKHNFINYANSDVLMITRERLEVILRKELEKHNTRWNCGVFMSWCAPCFFAGLSTQEKIVTICGMTFPLAVAFYLASFAFLGLTAWRLIRRWKTVWKHDFVSEVFASIEANKADIASPTKTQATPSILGNLSVGLKDGSVNAYTRLGPR